LPEIEKKMQLADWPAFCISNTTAGNPMKESMKSDCEKDKEVLVEFEKGKYWSLTLPAHWQGRSVRSARNEGLFHVTVTETRAGELINCGMECHVFFGQNYRVAGRVERIFADTDCVSLEIITQKELR
jgi:hypothetical protein